MSKLMQIRITTVISSLAAGGAQRNLIRLSDELAARGAFVTLLTTDPFTEDFYSVPSSVARIHAHPDAFLSCPWFDVLCQGKRKRALRESILDTNPDVVISFIDTMNISVLLALGNSRVPVIVSERVDPRSHVIGWRWSLLRWWAYPRAAKVVVQTSAILSWAERFLPKSRVVVIPNPVSMPSLVAYNRMPCTKIITGMGRLAPQKGFDLLIQAFSLIAKEFQDWQLLIIGEGQERDNLEHLINISGLAARVQLLGQLDDPFPVLAASDVFVLSSRYEGFPMALVEAMSLGAAVISFDCQSGPTDIVRPGIDGLLVPAGDVEALAGAMRRLVNNPEERQRFGSSASEVGARFTPQSIYDQWEAVIRHAVGER